MSIYNFKRNAQYIEYGCVSADSEKEAIEKIMNDDYDDIFDTSFCDFDKDSVEITDICEDEGDDDE